MAQVDFYQLSRDPVERVVPVLAAKVLDSGARLLVTSGDPDQRSVLSEALWAREGFLANGAAGDPHADRQPILIAADCLPANGARHLVLADGQWRAQAAGFDRIFLLFAPDQRDTARGLWAHLSGEGHGLRIFKQGEAGGWKEGR